jgi:D-alanine--poly(phosphoribitol) ligase subunit 2
MADQEKVSRVVFEVIDEINKQLKDGKTLKQSEETVLFGKGGVLDSLGLVNLIVTAEQRVTKEFGVNVTLVDEKAMSEKVSPFKTIGTLSEYITKLLAEKSNG